MSINPSEDAVKIFDGMTELLKQHVRTDMTIITLIMEKPSGEEGRLNIATTANDANSLKLLKRLVKVLEGTPLTDEDLVSETKFKKRIQSEKAVEAQKKFPKVLCNRCHEPAYAKTWSDAGVAEVGLSGYCETCWTEIYGEGDNSALFAAWQRKMAEDKKKGGN